MRSFVAELKKTKYRQLWLVVVGTLMIQFLWCSFSLVRADAEDLRHGYQYMLYMMPLLNTLFLAMVLAVLASRIWDIEHKGDTLKLLYTLQNPASIYKSKTVLGTCYLLILTALQPVMIILLGKIFKFGDACPVEQLGYFFLTAFTVSCLVYGLQQILTFSFKNQMVPLSFGLFGSFLGLFSLFFPRKLQYFVIWAYYSLLQTTSMSWDETTHIMSFYEVNFNWPTFLIVLVLAVLCYGIGKRMFLSKEV